MPAPDTTNHDDIPSVAGTCFPNTAKPGDTGFWNNNNPASNAEMILTTLSYESRTLLTNIVGSADTINAFQASLPPELRESAQTIIQSSRQLLRTIQSVFLLVKLSEKSLGVQLKPVSLCESLVEACQRNERFARERKIPISASSSAVSDWVMTDNTALATVFDHFLEFFTRNLAPATPLDIDMSSSIIPAAASQPAAQERHLVNIRFAGRGTKLPPVLAQRIAGLPIKHSFLDVLRQMQVLPSYDCLLFSVAHDVVQLMGGSISPLENGIVVTLPLVGTTAPPPGQYLDSSEGLYDITLKKQHQQQQQQAPKPTSLTEAETAKTATPEVSEHFVSAHSSIDREAGVLQQGASQTPELPTIASSSGSAVTLAASSGSSSASPAKPTKPGVVEGAALVPQVDAAQLRALKLPAINGAQPNGPVVRVIPLTQQVCPIPQRKPDGPPAKPKSERHLLVVEDNMINQRILRNMLHKLGFTQITFAADGADALFHYNSLKDEGKYFDAILMDISLPSLSGNDTCAWIRQKDRTQVIIMCTADTQMVGNAARWKAFGYDDAIEKPVFVDVLSTILNRWLDKGDARRVRQTGVKPSGNELGGAVATAATTATTSATK